MLFNFFLCQTETKFNDKSIRSCSLRMVTLINSVNPKENDSFILLDLDVIRNFALIRVL